MATKAVKGSEKVYALHDFDAENPDEVSFKSGETIIVVEKDDAYGDGWWQGTNSRGETGLFPFSYTTYDKDAVTAQSTADAPAAAAAAATGAAAATTAQATQGDASREANGKGVKATIDDIDNALARMQAGKSENGDDASERTGDLSIGETEEGADAEDDYEKRSKARAALAINAAKKNEDLEQAEREEQARLKEQAMRVFEQEEEKHRQLLLQKEEERKAAAAKGVLPAAEKQQREAPIPGVDMSDESDSEGSEGPDFDDVAPTHAPLFGGNGSSAPSAAATAGAAGIGAVAGAGIASTLKPQQSPRPLSPIASEDAHAKASAANAEAKAKAVISSANDGVHPTAATTTFRPAVAGEEHVEDQSVDSSRISTGSPAPGKSLNTVHSIGTAPTSLMGTETPRSSHVQGATMSPAPSVAGSRGGGPGGDPHEWSVEQVVEWARYKGWDEASVVSKFVEHEISGDVLMEMDANILKEIDITAFGKRFQVANAIKDLKKGAQPSSAVEPSTTQWSAPPMDSASSNTFQQQQRSASQPIHERASSGPQLPASAGPTAIGLGAPINGVNMAGGDGQRSTSTATAPPDVSNFHSIIQPDAADAPSVHSNDQGSLRGGAGNSADENYIPPSFSAGGQYNNKATFSPDAINYSNFNQQHATNQQQATSPRRRESAGSSTKSPSDRTSFFAGLAGQRNRKPAPRVQSGGSVAATGAIPAVIENEPSQPAEKSKGTLSRLGFNRLKGSQASDSSSSQDIRNKISLPTGSPTFDAMGDTARRHRLSQLSPSNASTAIPGFGTGAPHQRQTSYGSGGPGAADWNANNEPKSPGGENQEGAVMMRIRPVDFEGWMRKKGERYNTWKPRYLALKGSDLVLLRDPLAPKIKGYVNMKGYKVIADENTNPGKYGFKILHETEKPHYFSSDDAIIVREWMKALMKATIGRDTSLPVISSYNNATISLKEAQRMNPPPRPPSPTSRARAQRAAARANKDQLTAKDASVLMGLQSPSERQLGFIEPNSPLREADEVKQRMQDVIHEQQEPTDYSIVDHATGPLMKANRKGEGRPESHPARVAPLPFIPCQKPRYLPELDRTEDEDHTSDGLAVRAIRPKNHSGYTAGPTPPSKPSYGRGEQKGQVVTQVQDELSPTMGLADLPPPPPPTHSADHIHRVRASIQSQSGAHKRPGSASPAPTPPTKSARWDGEHGGALDAVRALPPPLSKDTIPEVVQSEASSVASYPTVSSGQGDGQAEGDDKVLNSAPVAGRHGDRTSLRLEKIKTSESAKELVNLAGDLATTTKAGEPLSNPIPSLSLSAEEYSPRDALGEDGGENVALSSSAIQSAGSHVSRLLNKATKFTSSRRPHTADDGRARVLSLGSRKADVNSREGSFIVFSVRRQTRAGTPQGPHSHGSPADRDDQKQVVAKEGDTKELKVFDQPLQVSPEAYAEHWTSDEGGKSDKLSPERQRLRTISSRISLVSRFKNTMSSTSGKEPNLTSDRRALFHSPSLKKQTSLDEKTNAKQRRHNSLDGSGVIHSELKSSIHHDHEASWKDELLRMRRKKATSPSPSMNMLSASRSAISLSLLAEHNRRSVISPFDFETERAEMRSNSSTPSRYGDLELSGQPNDANRSLAAAGSAANEQPPPPSSTSSQPLPSSGGENRRHLGFRSWLRWKSERERQRDSDMELERRMMQAQAELKQEEGPHSSSSRSRSASVGRSGQLSSVQLRSASQVEDGTGASRQRAHEAEGNNSFWALRSNSLEYFGRMRMHIGSRGEAGAGGEQHQENGPDNDEYRLPVPYTSHAELATDLFRNYSISREPTATSAPANGGVYANANRRGSESVEELITYKDLGGGRQRAKHQQSHDSPASKALPGKKKTLPPAPASKSPPLPPPLDPLHSPHHAELQAHCNRLNRINVNTAEAAHQEQSAQSTSPCSPGTRLEGGWKSYSCEQLPALPPGEVQHLHASSQLLCQLDTLEVRRT